MYRAEDGSRYEGSYKNDKKEGKGMYFFINKDYYEGEYVNNKK